MLQGVGSWEIGLGLRVYGFRVIRVTLHPKPWFADSGLGGDGFMTLCWGGFSGGRLST